jgi:hypothetical protein
MPVEHYRHEHPLDAASLAEPPTPDKPEKPEK